MGFEERQELRTKNQGDLSKGKQIKPTEQIKLAKQKESK